MMKLAVTEPELPSVTVASVIDKEGASSGGHVLSLTNTDALFPEPLFAVASSHPSPLKSPIATPDRYALDSDGTGGENVPSPRPRSTLTPLPEPVDTAMSSLPSPFRPLKSPRAIPTALPPEAKLWVAPKLPSPLPRRTLTVSPYELAVTMSAFPSPLISAAATDTGFHPALKYPGDCRVPPTPARATATVPYS